MDEEMKIYRVVWMTIGGALSISDRLGSTAAETKLRDVVATDPVFVHLVMLSANSKFNDETWELVS